MFFTKWFRVDLELFNHPLYDYAILIYDIL